MRSVKTPKQYSTSMYIRTNVLTYTYKSTTLKDSIRSIIYYNNLYLPVCIVTIRVHEVHDIHSVLH